MDICRLILDPPAAGTWNMAVDEALLDSAVNDGVATLRLYRWSEPTLSLGYFQRYDDRHTHPASAACAVVRRQSGGGAILHDHELTYSLALPPGHRLTHDATALYTAVHQAFVELLAPRLARSNASARLELNPIGSSLPPSGEPFLCFQRRAVGDLLLHARDLQIDATNSAPRPYKILGSAQRRHRGAILQHGSLLIAGSTAAPELPGWQELTGDPLTAEELIAALVRQLGGLVEIDQKAGELPQPVHVAARRIEENKYSSRSWTARR